MPIPDLVNICVDDIINKVKSIPEIQDSSFEVHSNDVLMSEGLALPTPYVGVLYKGITSKGNVAASGLGTTLSVSVLLMASSKKFVFGGVEFDGAITLLDKLRAAIALTTSPSKHKWKLEFEVPVDYVDGNLLFEQQWSTTVNLT